MNKIYRTDIDGLRAIAVISVILFHLGFLKNGYLGVDIFFVISGYLITGIVYNESIKSKFSIFKFYERRIRRIFPLVLFTTFISLVIGVVFMLPDDLENLSQSIIATNFSANNILLYITSVDYWAIANDYKPLMHTWSLGIEEQFYLLFPLLFFTLKNNTKYILPVLSFLSILSLLFFLNSKEDSSKFFFLQYRFFELSIGGICAIFFIKNKAASIIKYDNYLLYVITIFLFYLLFSNSVTNNYLNVLSITVFTSAILVFGQKYFSSNNFYQMLFCNKLMVGIGKISFSLYMWHQIVLAFSRYILLEFISVFDSFILIIIVFILSILSYYLIETPFRNKQKVSSKLLFLVVITAFILINGISLYFYSVKGIIRDVPEYSIKVQSKAYSNEHDINEIYNKKSHDFNNSFSDNKKIKILVIGDSFAGDFFNILNESTFNNQIEVRRMSSKIVDSAKREQNQLIKERADYIFYATKTPSFKKLVEECIDLRFKNKLYVIGIKNFGFNNGIPYNNKNKNCIEYRTSLKDGILKLNNDLSKEWGIKYIDLIKLVSDSGGRVLVYTPDCKFISQDTDHLTSFGAKYYAYLLDSKLRKLLNIE